MTDRGPARGRFSFLDPTTTAGHFSVVRMLRERALHSTHLIGLLTLLITGTIFLLLTGITVTTTFLGFLFLAPLLIITSPLWAPITAVLFVVIAGLLSISGVALVTIGSVSWLYRYVRGMHPPGSDGVDYARSRIYDTANNFRGYAREYGGYMQTKVKDIAPGA